MNWNELLDLATLDKNDVIVTVINPVRKNDIYKTGKMTGFKSGIYGGGHYNYKQGTSRSFDSGRIRYLKRPKVHVTYNIGDWGKKQHSDWIDVDNCSFEIKSANQ